VVYFIDKRQTDTSADYSIRHSSFLSFDFRVREYLFAFGVFLLIESIRGATVTLVLLRYGNGKLRGFVLFAHVSHLFTTP
jgi:hypothetical protein